MHMIKTVSQPFRQLKKPSQIKKMFALLLLKKKKYPTPDIRRTLKLQV